MNNFFGLLNKGIITKRVKINVILNKNNIKISKYLYSKGYIFYYNFKFKYIEIGLKYYKNKNVIQNLHINNKKKKHINKIKYKDIKKQYYSGKKDLLILSKIGLINMKKALYYKIGGNILVLLAL